MIQSRLGQQTRLCQQAQIDEQVASQEPDFVGYAIRAPKHVGTDEPQLSFNDTILAANVLGSTSFGIRSRLPKQLLVPSVVDESADEPFANHYQCYLVIPPQIALFDVAISVQEDAPASVLRISRLSQFCTPTSKNGENTRDLITSLLCYDVIGRRTDDAGGSYILYNQFGSNALRVSRPRELCVPSSHVVMSPGALHPGDN